MKKKSSIRKVINVFASIVLTVAVAVVVFVFIARLTGNVPSLFGYSVFRVRSDSMTPTLLVNDVILDKKVKPQDIHNGDIISYKCLSGDMAGQTITHRVVEEPKVRGGIYYYHTKGDKEGAVMDAEIEYSQVEGIFVCKLPLLDKLYTFFLSPYGLITFIFVILVLFGYEMISLIVSYRSLDEHDDDYYQPKPKKPSKKRKKKK